MQALSMQVEIDPGKKVLEESSFRHCNGGCNTIGDVKQDRPLAAPIAEPVSELSPLQQLRVPSPSY